MKDNDDFFLLRNRTKEAFERIDIRSSMPLCKLSFWTFRLLAHRSACKEILRTLSIETSAMASLILDQMNWPDDDSDKCRANGIPVSHLRVSILCAYVVVSVFLAAPVFSGTMKQSRLVYNCKCAYPSLSIPRSSWTKPGVGHICPLRTSPSDYLCPRSPVCQPLPTRFGYFLDGELLWKRKRARIERPIHIHTQTRSHIGLFECPYDNTGESVDIATTIGANILFVYVFVCTPIRR